MATENKKFLDLAGLTAYNTKVKQRIDNVNSNLQTQISALASGAPLAASSTAEMTDTSKVYVNTTDGDWYYYNGSSWVSGGTYQSSGVADDSIGLDNIKDGITKFNLYQPAATLISSNTRIRVSDRPFFRAGSVFEFNIPENFQWNIVKHVYEPSYSYQTVLGWTGSTTKYEVTADARYEINFRKVGEPELSEDDISTVLSALKCYSVIKNIGNRVIEYYPSQTNKIELTEQYSSGGSSNNIHIRTDVAYFILCENYVHYTNARGWQPATGNIHYPYQAIKYDLSSYGTVTEEQSSGYYIGKIDVVLPNNYVLILNTLDTTMRVKPVLQLDPNEIVLVRNSAGYCGGGVFTEMVQSYNVRKNASDIYSLQTTISAFNPDFDDIVKGINHRGYNPIAPENTIPAFQESKRQGFKYVETDVSFTSDRVPVLLHDATIDRTSNGTGQLGDMTYNEVSQYDFGSWKSEVYAGTKIPTLQEFLVVCRNLGLHPYLELKNAQNPTEAEIQGVVDMVEACGMKGKVTYSSFLDELLTYVKDYDEEARIGYTPNTNTITQAYIDRAVALKTGKNEVIFSPDYNNVTSTVIDMCKAADLPLEVWTIGNPTTIVGLDPYVTGVTSNNLIAGKVLFEATIN